MTPDFGSHGVDFGETPSVRHPPPWPSAHSSALRGQHACAHCPEARCRGCSWADGQTAEYVARMTSRTFTTSSRGRAARLLSTLTGGRL
jgi:hypothetical protein